MDRILPCPIWPLAQHVRFGQNCSDGSIGSVVVVLHTHSMPGTVSIFKLFPLFHQLVGLYPFKNTANKNKRFLDKGGEEDTPRCNHFCWNSRQAYAIGITIQLSLLTELSTYKGSDIEQAINHLLQPVPADYGSLIVVLGFNYIQYDSARWYAPALVST